MTVSCGGDIIILLFIIIDGDGDGGRSRKAERIKMFQNNVPALHPQEILCYYYYSINVNMCYTGLCGLSLRQNSQEFLLFIALDYYDGTRRSFTTTIFLLWNARRFFIFFLFSTSPCLTFFFSSHYHYYYYY